MTEASLIEGVLAGLFGLLIGSFLNVCIHRWPENQSVVAPRSRCPACGHQIVWYDNIPVLSWLLLRARCRHCRGPIHWRYPLVEILAAACFFWFGAHLGLTLAALKYCVFAAMLIGLLFSDLETLLLPDQFTIGGLFLGLAFAPFVAVPDSSFRFAAALAGYAPGPQAASLGEALLGGILPSGALWLTGWLFEKLRHKEGLGFGDVKMIAMIGAFLGLRGALLTIILGSLAGSVVGLVYIKATRRDPGEYQLPFGAFLGAAALSVAVSGQAWYWSLFG
jgi:leader peptidase (prepilin peptidase)/N-methyltransferase